MDGGEDVEVGGPHSIKAAYESAQDFVSHCLWIIVCVGLGVHFGICLCADEQLQMSARI